MGDTSSSSSSGKTNNPLDDHRKNDRYRKLLNSIDEAFAILEVVWENGGVATDYIILEANSIFEKQLRRKSSDILGRRASELYPNLESRWFDSLGRVAKTGESAFFESYNKDNDKYYEICGYRIASDQIGIFFKDVTEQKKAEGALKLSEARFRSLYENSHDAVFLTNAKGTVFSANPAACSLFGMTEEEIRKSGRKGLLVMDKRAKVALKEREVMGKEEAELAFKRKDGSIFEAEVSSVIFKDVSGENRASLIIRDITKRKKTEEALKESEEKFRSLVESTSDWIWQVDKNAVYTYSSPKVKELLGYEPEEVLGKKPFDLMPKDEALEISKIFEEIAKNKKPFRGLENCNVHKNGNLVLLETNGTPILNERGRLIGYRGIDRDITERKKAEEELYRSRELLSSIINSSDSAIFARDINERMILLNNAQSRAYNIPKERALGTTPYDIYPRDVADKLVAWDKKVLTEGKSVRFEETVPLGKVQHTFATNKFPLRDSDGKIYGLGAVVTDITERKKDEIALRRSEEHLKMAQKIAHLGSWEFDVKDNKAIWSEELFKIFNLSPQQYGPNLEAYLRYIHPDDAKFVRENLAKFQLEGRIGFGVSFDYRVILDDGSVRYLHTERMTTEVDEAGKTSKVSGIEQDITDRQMVEHQLQHYRKNLEALVEERTRQLKDAERLAAIGQTAGMVGHDIRNPLQAILSDVYLLKFDLTAMPQSATKEEVAESLGSIEENIGYINKIVADLQDYARPLNPDYSEVSLSDLVAGVFQNLIIPENINLSIDIKAFKRLNTDPTFIRRALTNLVNNAIQAMSGGGKLEVSGFEKEDKVYITVSDTGPGIPKEIKAKLFTPMVTTKAKGQGLGLAVVKRLIEAMEGTIIFESEEDKGTKFIIELPMSLRR